MAKKLTQEEFIERSIAKHGNKYNYTKTTYITTNIKVTIFCNSCQDYFEQIPSDHYNHGCSKCARSLRGKESKKTTKQFIIEAKEVHGDKYDYSKTEYNGSHKKVVIICRKHGEENIGAIEHLRGANCYKCGKESMASMCRTTKNKFIEDSQKIHGDKYDYSKVEYINNRTKVTIGCPIHGDYKKVPEKHISGSGCRKCLNESNTKTTEEFIEACKIIHKGLYGYDKTAYINSNENVIITCSIHGDYIQKAGSHRCGNGCLQCAKETTVFKRSHYIRLADKANLYLIKLSNEDEEFYKIGKTINNISKRFAKNSLPYKYEVITLINKDSGFIYDLEIKLHRKYKEYKYKPNIDFAGHTECYNLNLPIEEIINL